MKLYENICSSETFYAIFVDIVMVWLKHFNLANLPEKVFVFVSKNKLLLETCKNNLRSEKTATYINFSCKKSDDVFMSSRNCYRMF